jgi:hypothetical protein
MEGIINWLKNLDWASVVLVAFIINVISQFVYDKIPTFLLWTSKFILGNSLLVLRTLTRQMKDSLENDLFQAEYYNEHRDELQMGILKDIINLTSLLAFAGVVISISLIDIIPDRFYPDTIKTIGKIVSASIFSAAILQASSTTSLISAVMNFEEHKVRREKMISDLEDSEKDFDSRHKS